MLLASLALPTACGGPAGTETPGALATPAPVTPAPTIAPTEDPGVSFALPSIVPGDADLEALLPDELGGKSVTKLSLGGESFLGGSPGSGTDDIAAMLEQFDKEPSDLSVAFGGTADISITAYKVNGVPATEAYAVYLQLAQDAGGGVATDATLGGKAVKKVVSPDGTVYVYTSGDVLFSVVGDGVAPQILSEAFSKLP